MDFTVIPSIEQLRQRPAIRALEARFGAEATVDALRTAAVAVRQAIAGGSADFASEALAGAGIEAGAAAALARAFRPSLVPVINASGVILHTNLGRAPLAASAVDRVSEIARGYATLEYDLARGQRGRRDVHAEALLCRLTGAEAAVVVNNNAAATMIVLAALAAGREVVVSRGELVEIGGGFRVPDVMAQSGAVLREVGTTNKTRVADYAAAIGDRTALILRVHPSNFRIEGFTERPALADLVALGKKFNIPVAEDLGSGHLGTDTGRTGVGPGSDPVAEIEPSVAETMAKNADVCCFSGDKLLGGPQAGIIVGRKALVDRIRTHPLMRALRVDKLTYAALEATLIEYAAGRAGTTIPVQRMLTMTADEVRGRAEALATALNQTDGWRATLVAGASAVGGGSAPGLELPTWLVAIEKRGLTPDALETRLRGLTPPVIARIEKDQVLLDLRTVLPDQDSALAGAIRGVKSEG
ncbi:MAG: L-seryl-tRNA(Sec) selenium transferase [Acidobacteriia bacterium]|nr:L-seryl-tRNA(Sec) selenium transferase [Terriglobia bacterium]